MVLAETCSDPAIGNKLKNQPRVQRVNLCSGCHLCSYDEHMCYWGRVSVPVTKPLVVIILPRYSLSCKALQLHLLTT